MKTIKTFLFVSIILLLFSCKENNLTREEAAKQIITITNLPQQVTATLDNSESLYRDLVQNGLVHEEKPIQNENYNNSGGGLFIPQVSAVIGYEHGLTADGNKYKVGEQDYYPVVKLGDLVFDEITGIADIMENIKEVEYNLKYTNITPFGDIMLKTSKVAKTVTFRKYDDGWRIE